MELYRSKGHWRTIVLQGLGMGVGGGRGVVRAIDITSIFQS